MRAALYLSAGNVIVDDVPDASLSQPTDAVVRVLRSCVCGSDLWSYRGVINRAERSRLGHEFIGLVEEVGSEVGTLRVGDLVVAPFMWSDNTCPACVDGIQSSCDNGGTFGAPGTDGGQGEAVRVPQADGTLVAVPGGMSGVDESLYAALLSASDVMATGLHGAVLAGVTEGSTVAVIGDGAVGLCAVLGAKAILGAERIFLMSRHEDRAAIGRSFGATDVIAERGDEGIAAVRERTGGLGVRHVVEAVGTPESWAMAVGMAREGGSIGAVGIPHTAPELPLFQPLIHHLSLNLGIAPVRRYLPDLVSRITAGTLDPGSVFDAELPLADVAQGYAAMAARESIKVMLK
ncbi:alcohol dehydrogenase catalytic domain-containing protein [Streptosporangium sp. 'caverna']|uniref:zinc-binding dehydrogenase n=1 Tax=Streptosporangium sp. 'caverna' TaxID=2202249 RepID=UPI000D7D7ECC|nr:alcohol dehydrogenase catalytic domain-containing protein [Streptosporangium sp. 'caverna']AWS42209.1 IMP dehydrogenase [Streptosporangium sp. 'caverna']